MENENQIPQPETTPHESMKERNERWDKGGMTLEEQARVWQGEDYNAQVAESGRRIEKELKEKQE